MRWIEKLSENLHERSRWRLKVILLGIIWAQGLMTVTSWLRGAGVGIGYQEYYYFLSALGKITPTIGTALFSIILSYLLQGTDKIVAAIDDTPTRRFGPKVEGAGLHHDSSSKPTDQTLLYGHLWVTIGLLMHHSRFGTIALNLLSKLYIRSCDVEKLPQEYGWTFKTKLQLGAELVQWLYSLCVLAGISLWIVFDGAFTKRGFLRNLPAGVIAVGRLRKDGSLSSVPEPHQGRGRPRKYGKYKFSLPKRAGQNRGWQTTTIRGKTVQYKVFHATCRLLGGKILVIIRRYDNGDWAPFFCSDPDADPLEVLEVILDRWAIEENFQEVKETLGAGQQQVRNLWSNIACWHLCIWTFVLVHLWSWFKSDNELKDRSLSPWDSQERRPSFADRLRSLRRLLLGQEIFDSPEGIPKNSKIRRVFEKLYRLVC
jgi:hypothetical protein